MDKKAQFNVFEAIASVGIIFVSLTFAYIQFSAPATSSTVEALSFKLKMLCNDVLRTLDETESDNLSYSSLLVEIIMENRTSDFVNAMTKILSPSVFYNVWIYDGIKRMLWYPDKPQQPFGNVAVAHRMIWYRGNVYSVELEAWGI